MKTIVVRWLKNGKPLLDGEGSMETELSNGQWVSKLPIKSVSVEDAGNYQCLVTNLISSSMASSILAIEETEISNPNMGIFSRVRKKYSFS